jgi:hypothetical protein
LALASLDFWLWLHLAFGFCWVFVPHIFVWGSCFFRGFPEGDLYANYNTQLTTRQEPSEVNGQNQSQVKPSEAK